MNISTFIEIEKISSKHKRILDPLKHLQLEDSINKKVVSSLQEDLK